MTSQTDNPYRNLEGRAFWKRAVADHDGMDYPHLWRPRFAITPQTRFITAGSCFAQHISRWLKGNGYAWLDSEPAPPALPPAQWGEQGYGVFSFRTGNIYTAALLRQWIEWALGIRPVCGEVWQNEHGRVTDPFRPLLPPDGFADQADLLRARAHSLDCMRETLTQANVFVFTLGLTEGWQHVDGHCYPMCPGTAGGAFDPASHRFVNYDFATIRADLDQAFDAIRRINPTIRFLLTVSPVPLTATMSGDHVLSATTYSKSVLRAVAGALKSCRDDVDYFPSYELISGFPSRGRHYEDNLRSVKTSGVDHVMSHFSRAIQGWPELSPAPPPNSGGESESPTPTSGDDGDVFCEDVLLERWASPDTAAAPMDEVRLCLLGDSHMDLLSQALSDMNIPHCGGKIMNGSAWHQDRFHPDPDEVFVPLEDKGARHRWRLTLPFFSLPPQGRTIILNLCAHSHMGVLEFVNEFAARHGHLNMTYEDLTAYALQRHAAKLTLVRSLIDKGYRVVFLADPPTQDRNPHNLRMSAVFPAYDAVICQLLAKVGCETLKPRDLFPAGAFPPVFYSERVNEGVPDWIHGSALYYAAVSAVLRDRFTLA